MDQLYFLKPFALSGDRVTVPMSIDPSGQISFDQGWGVDYQRDPTTDPNAKDIDRAQTNYLFWAVTTAIKAWQENTYPEWITVSQNGGVPFAYPAGTIVKYRAVNTDPFKLYVATPDRANQPNSTSVPGTDNQWKLLAIRTADQADSIGLSRDDVLMTPLQTKYAVQQYIASLNLKQFPTGQFVPWSADTPPVGVLVCNGAAVSRTTYAALFAIIGIKYGAGDGATTFNLPNIPAGYGLRQTDGLNGANYPMYGQSVGALIAHAHSTVVGAAGGHTHTAGTSAAGGHTHAASSDNQGTHSHSGYTDTQGYHAHDGSTNAAGDHNHASADGNNNYITAAYGSIGYQGAGNPRLNTTTMNNAGNHAHSFTTNGNGAHSHNVATDSQGLHAHNISVAGVGDHTHAVTVNAVGDHTHAVTVNATGGSANIAAGVNVLMCIAF